MCTRIRGAGWYTEETGKADFTNVSLQPTTGSSSNGGNFILAGGQQKLWTCPWSALDFRPWPLASFHSKQPLHYQEKAGSVYVSNTQGAHYRMTVLNNVRKNTWFKFTADAWKFDAVRNRVKPCTLSRRAVFPCRKWRICYSLNAFQLHFSLHCLHCLNNNIWAHWQRWELC